MKRKSVYLMPMLVLFVLSSCRMPNIGVNSMKSNDKYSSVKLRVKIISNSRTEKIKILLGFNNTGDRLIFLGPMNQVLFEILIQGNRSKIIVPRRKQYWIGEFEKFLYDLWHIGLSYNEIKALLLEQRVNSKKLHNCGFTMQIFESETKKHPIEINLKSDDIRLEFKVYKIKKRSGKIVFTRDLKKYKKVSLKHILNKNSE